MNPRTGNSNADALVGFSGFVGGNLMRQHAFSALFNSKNVEELRGRTFRRLVHAGTQAKKWWANEHPEEDWRGISRALTALRAVHAEDVVLISTIDVVPPEIGATETAAVDDAPGMHPYGSNRRRLERELESTFPNLTIVRLPALFGPGLKKNVIYDLLHDNMLEAINPQSSFQYYDLTRLWADLEHVISAGVRVMHLVPEPVETSDVVDCFFPGKRIGENCGPVARYDYRTIHGSLVGGSESYIYNRHEVMTLLGRFIRQTAGSQGE